jgi:hypothetical protein
MDEQSKLECSAAVVLRVVFSVFKLSMAPGATHGHENGRGRTVVVRQTKR